MRICDKQFSSDVEHCYVMIAGTQVSRGDYLLINGSIQGIYKQSHKHSDGDNYRYCIDIRNKGITWMTSSDIKSVVKQQKAKWKCMGDELRNWTPPW